MKHMLPLFLFLLLATAPSVVKGQNLVFSRYIFATDTIEDNGVLFAASSDDAEQQNDEIDALFDDDLDAGWEGDPADLNILSTGLRFRQVFIPQGATIDSAFIVLNSHEAKTADDVARITIAAQAADHAETFNETDLITERPRTSAQLLWEVDEEWGLWTYHRTPDLSALVQEVVSRDGWNSGNAIAFFFLGEDQGVSEVENSREWESFENIADPDDGGDGQNHPERVPRLFITFSSPNLVNTAFEAASANVKALTLFPNPANQSVTLELENESAAFIRIFHMDGRLVKALQSDRAQLVTVPAGDLVPGVYTVQAVQDGTLYVQKLLVSR